MIALYHMDGGLVSAEPNEEKCDYLYIVYDSKPTFIFVELKGKHIKHAIDQIQNAIGMFGGQITGRICARIICSAVPRLHNDPEVKKLRKKLNRMGGGSLKISENNMNEEYVEI